MTDTVPVFGETQPSVRRVDLDRPWQWLAAGWADLRRAPKVSLVYGAVLAGISLAIAAVLLAGEAFYLLLPLTAGFALVAPLLAVGLYETSRLLAEGRTPTLALAMAAYRRNATQLALLGFVLALLHLAWVRFATLLYAIFFSTEAPPLPLLLDHLISPAGLPFLIVGSAIGFVLAALAFAIAAVSIPMLIDRDTNAFAAIATSFVAVGENLRPMALWAALIAFFTALGLATFFLGLAVALPLIAHATWHCYRDVVIPQPSDASASQPSVAALSSSSGPAT